MTRLSQSPVGFGEVTNKEVASLIQEADQLGRKGEYPSALAKASQAVALDPNCSAALAERARLHAVTGSFDPSISDYTRSLEITPNATYSRIGRAEARMSLGKYDEAIGDLLKAKETQPLVGSVQLTLAYFLKQDYEKALQQANTVINEQHLSSRLILGLRGMASYHLGQHKAAFNDLNQAIGDGSIVQPIFHLYRARLHDEAAQYKLALEDYRAVLTSKNLKRLWFPDTASPQVSPSPPLANLLSPARAALLEAESRIRELSTR